MKVRNGFVSNSSSSSFIIAIARVKDEDKLKEVISKCGYIDHKSIGTSSELAEADCGYTHYNKNTNNIWTDSFTDSVVELKVESLDEKFLVYHNYRGDESDFWDEECEEYNYDYDIAEGLMASDMSILKNLEENGIISDLQIDVGCGRDG